MILSKCNDCGTRIDYGKSLCKECSSKRLKQRHERDKAADNVQAIYLSYEWRKLKHSVREFYPQYDMYIYEKYGRMLPVQVFHHIIPVSKENKDEMAFKWENIIGLSKEGHREVHELYRKSLRDKSETISLLQRLINDYNDKAYDYLL